MTTSKWVKSDDVLTGEDNLSGRTDGNGIDIPAAGKAGGPLKPRLDAVQRKIELQVQRLDELHKGMKARDDESVRRLVSSIKENNVQSSAVLSTDLAKGRQASRVIALSKISLEKLAARLGTVSDFGDLVVVISPAMSVVKNLRSSLISHLPEMEQDFGAIAELLSGILVDAGQVGGFTINFESANEEGVRLIDEASHIVDQQMKEEFSGIPDVPGLGLPSVSGLA
ncbi:MAG: hypothetical protein ABI361_10505 [Nitrososphaera sp.]|jgi:division protein CdvB (Snf7/Vps24/ESCRT-III family)